MTREDGSCCAGFKEACVTMLPFTMISFSWRSAFLPNTVQWLMPKLDQFMKSLQKQTRFAECPGVEHCNDESQLWTWRTFIKLKTGSLGTQVLCCGTYDREDWFFKAIKRMQAKNSRTPGSLGSLWIPVVCSMWEVLILLIMSWSCTEGTSPCSACYSPCSIFRLETRRFAGSETSKLK